MSTEHIPDLIINYAYSRKEEIQKHRVLPGHEQNAPSRQIDDAKITEIDNWIKFLIDTKNGRLDISKTTRTWYNSDRSWKLSVSGFYTLSALLFMAI